jgi:hypothetical protein
MSIKDDIKMKDQMGSNEGILQFKFSGVNYPLDERCLKELRYPPYKLFTKP